MKVIFGINELEASGLSNVITTLGSFDGVHAGHTRIISTMLEHGRDKGLAPVLLTFHPHPQIVLGRRGPTELLTTLEEKLQLFEKIGVDTVVILDFNRQLASYPPENFVRDVLIDKMGMKALVIGYDHAFGKDRSGNKELLERMSKSDGFDFLVVPEFKINNQTVKSTIIRELLKAGEFDLARRALGYNYFMTGKVIKGHGVGKGLGFPTINLAIPSGKLLPKDGVYSALTSFDGVQYAGMAYIGARLTFGDTSISVEVNLFDFGGKTDSDHAALELTDYIRPPEKFKTPGELAQQMKLDEIEIRKKFSNKEALS
jgi:riboflavin kinase/FMN adenylyltransferase